MAPIILLQLTDDGSPMSGGSSNGVVTLPSVPRADDYKTGDAVFTLRFLIEAGSPITNGGHIWTNTPADSGSLFERGKFQKHRIGCSFYEDSIVDVDIFKPGSYSYFVSYLNTGDPNSLEGEDSKSTRKFYFIVPPVLYIGDQYIPPNAITLQTIVSKWMSKELPRWNEVFQHVSDKGYNMIHFAPLQKRGESNSPYSIYDQLTFDPEIFKDQSVVVDVMGKLKSRYGILSLTDVVWNHTANNSPWIRSHPEVGYNAETAPHLISAIELENGLLYFSLKMKSLGYPTVIESTADLLKIMEGVRKYVITPLKLWEFYVVDVESHVNSLEKAWIDCRGEFPPLSVPEEAKHNLDSLSSFIKHNCCAAEFGLGERFSNKLDSAKLASALLSVTAHTSVGELIEEAKKVLDKINAPLYKDFDEDVSVILEQVYNRTSYLRLESHGPKLGEITEESPLIEKYFTQFTDAEGKKWALANNGWVWAGNPLVDFASNQRKSYLRREVIIWGDCVKLRYGAKRDDSPFLWDHMMKYTRQCASIFQGFRIDNCHSTPLHVAEALLDVARDVNPDLYVVAELFTGSEEMDILFVERLGISSLIREAMQSHSVQELSRLVHMHGGDPIGSLPWLPLDDLAYPKEEVQNISKVSEICIPQIVCRQPTHALFMDCTHDNEMPNQKRTVEDTLPNAALVAFCSCGTGSVFGYDEVYPRLLDVVNEKKLYSFDEKYGIAKVKAQLNTIRKEIALDTMANTKDNEVYIHHEGQYITVHRLNARTGKGYLLIARSKFYSDTEQSLKPIELGGAEVEAKFSYCLEAEDGASESEDYLEQLHASVKSLDPPEVAFDENKQQSVITLPHRFPQGSIAVLSTSLIGCDRELDEYVREGALKAAENLTLVDLNALLYRCEPEERDASSGESGVYNIPGYGNLLYAGLQGWVTALKDVIRSNDLAHPIIEHLRQGHWAADYIVNRLEKHCSHDGVREIFNWLKSRFDRIKQVPYFVFPHYYVLVLGVAYEALRFQGLKLMSNKVQTSTGFVQSLGMCSVQMVGEMQNASLNPFEKIPSMAAGLPHFSSDFMRCWGRDVFLSLRGLLLATGRYEEAKLHICNFAMTVKHGLIPNLLGSGKDPRYNARDATWFFLQSIQDYATIVPGGVSILDEKVKRRFPLNDEYVPYNHEKAFSYESTIRQIICEILERHARGISFREANAGPQIDSQMKDEGFNISIFVDWKTGLIHGGNQFNCGTWMDKMGESEKAGSKGVPGTPRDGAAIEINGLLKSCLRFVNNLSAKGHIKLEKLTTQDGSIITPSDWEKLLQQNFERCFYVPQSEEDDPNYEIDPQIVHRRGFYKDLYRSGKPYEDYQLRANFPIAMCVAPELFDGAKALKALQIADKVIRGPIGIKTLDPEDYNYRPYYNNGEDSADFATSKGRNYHQGPEWVWLAGFFLRAFFSFHFHHHNACKSEDGKPTEYLQQLVSKRLAGHRKWLRESPWAGLTELTNKDGEFCADSSPTQAWSASCLLELYYDHWLWQERE